MELGDLQLVRFLADAVVPLFRVPRQEWPGGVQVVVEGASEPARSSFLHVLAGLRRPTLGWVRIDGVPLDHFSMQELRRWRRFHAGVLLPLPPSLFCRTVEECVALAAASVWPRRVRRARVVEALRESELLHARARPVRALDRFEARRAAWACAAVRSPGLVLVDRIEQGLGATAAAFFRRRIVELHDRGATVVLSRSDTDSARPGGVPDPDDLLRFQVTNASAPRCGTGSFRQGHRACDPATGRVLACCAALPGAGQARTSLPRAASRETFLLVRDGCCAGSWPAPLAALSGLLVAEALLEGAQRVLPTAAGAGLGSLLDATALAAVVAFTRFKGVLRRQEEAWRFAAGQRSCRARLAAEAGVLCLVAQVLALLWTWLLAPPGTRNLPEACFRVLTITALGAACGAAGGVRRGGPELFSSTAGPGELPPPPPPRARSPGTGAPA